MIHLWRWIQLRSSRLALAGIALLIGVAGCRSASTHSGYHNWSSNETVAPAALSPIPAPPYEDGQPNSPSPIVNPKTQPTDLGQPEVGLPKQVVPPKPDPADEPKKVKPADVSKPDDPVVPPKPKPKTPPKVKPAPKPDELKIPDAVVPKLPEKPAAKAPAVEPVPEKPDPKPVEKPTEKPTEKPAVKAPDKSPITLPVPTPEEPVPTPSEKPTKKPNVKPAPLPEPPLPDEPLPNPVPKPTTDKPAPEEKPTPVPPKPLPPTIELPKPDVPKPNPADKASLVDPLDPLTVFEPDTVEFVKPVKPNDVTETKPGKLPVIEPGPVQKKPMPTIPATVEVEKSGKIPQVSGSVKPTDKPPVATPKPVGKIPSDFVDPPSPLPVGERVQIRELTDFEFAVEHIAIGEDDSVFVSNVSSIRRFKADGRTETFAKTGSPRGDVVLPDGQHIVCDATQRAILKIDATGSAVEKLATKSDGYFLRAPKDAIVDAQGGVYFSDPGYARIRNPIGQIHYVGANGKVNVVAQRLAYPDGVVLSPDGSKLYVVESQTNQVLQFEILAPGKVGPKKMLYQLPMAPKATEGTAAGIAIDARGRLYVAHKEMSRIEVIDPDGRFLTSYQCGTLMVNDVAVRGTDSLQLVVGGTVGTEQGRGKLLLLDLGKK